MSDPLAGIDSDLLRRHYAMREEMCAAFITETRSGPGAIAIVREGSYPAAREWCVALGGPWRRRWARARLWLSPKRRAHVRYYAWRFGRFWPLAASQTVLVMEPTAGSLMRVRFEEAPHPSTPASRTDSSQTASETLVGEGRDGDESPGETKASPPVAPPSGTPGEAGGEA